jgi:SAM-dependent methyltransferase
VLREFHRVLRPGGAIVLETMHRDALARFTRAPSTRTWDPLPVGALYLQQWEPDWTAGTISTLHLVVTEDGERIERRFVHRVYSVKEWAEMLREAGFVEAEAFGGWDGAPPTPDVWRLVVRARRGLD